MPIHAHRLAILTRRPIGDTDFFLVCDQGLLLNLLVGQCVQYYKSLCAAVTICATLVNTQTDRHNILTSLYE